MPALAGSFVRLHDGSEGFLPDSAGGGAPEGTVLSVVVTRAAQGGKGPRLSAIVASPPEPGPVALLQRGPGAVERLARLHPTAPVEVDDAAVLAGLRHRLGDRIRLVRHAFDESVESHLESLGGSQAALAGGSRMSVHPTPALTAIDLDLAAASAGRGAKTRTHEQANRAALPGLARQIRLRNLSGAIVVDLAGLSPKRRGALGPALAESLAGDPLAPRFLGFSALGLAEILRPRIHPPLHELLGHPHSHGLAALRQASRDAAARPHLRLALRAAPAVLDALAADSLALADFTARAGHPISLRRDPSLAPSAWCIEETTHG